MADPDFQITLVGLNHRTADVDVRERFALTDRCSLETWPFSFSHSTHETFILSTCNRVEILGVAPENLETDLLNQWALACNSRLAELKPHTYTYSGLDAARHLFAVASSLDSMVLGEPQILGQMKAAYRKALEAGKAGAIINRLMHKAFYVAKRVRHETAVAASAVSISYAAVELAKRIFGTMPSHRAMLIGAGEMAELAAMHLLQAGIDEILVANRTYENGQELAQRFHGRAVPFEELAENLPIVDIVIASTGSKTPILNANAVKKALKARKNRPMFFIDIAVPRDIDATVNSLDNVYLYDIDDLKDVVEENMASRKEEANRATLIIEEELKYFDDWLKSLALKPTILDLIARGENAAQLELERALRKLGPVDEKTRLTLQAMAHSLVKRLNHAPLTYLKQNSACSDDSHARIAITRKIFNLNPPDSGSSS